MTNKDFGKVVGFEQVQDMRDRFLGWQCRLRQLAVREAGGHPSPGMKPQVSLKNPERILGRVIVVLTLRQSEETTAQFKYIVCQTQDPVERYEKGLKILQAEYYQRPREFSDKLTALFGQHSTVAARLLRAKSCTLHFEQYSQEYRIPCSVKVLDSKDPAYQATYWHNHLFNPRMPPGAQVLAFSPDWMNTTATRLSQSSYVQQSAL